MVGGHSWPRLIMDYMKLLLLLFCFLSVEAVGQNHFKVELEAFSPTEQVVIQTLKGRKAEQFLAKDLSDQEVSFYSTEAKIKLLWFWSPDNEDAMSLFPHLNLLQLDELEDMWIFGFSEGEKDATKKVHLEQGSLFSIIPNAKPIGQLAYGGDLGSNRLFIVDKDLIIQEVLPPSFFASMEPAAAISVIRDILLRMKLD